MTKPFTSPCSLLAHLLRRKVSTSFLSLVSCFCSLGTPRARAVTWLFLVVSHKYAVGVSKMPIDVNTQKHFWESHLWSLHGRSNLAENAKGTSRAPADHYSNAPYKYSLGFVLQNFICLLSFSFTLKSRSSNPLPVCWSCSCIAYCFAASPKVSVWQIWLKKWPVNKTVNFNLLQFSEQLYHKTHMDTCFRIKQERREAGMVRRR